VSTQPGDVVEIVLDVVHVSGPDKDAEFERVLVQGVFPHGSALPPLPAGAARNVVQVFFGRDMHGVAAFLIKTDIPAGDTARGGTT
jgi:hypothetical protein